MREIDGTHEQIRDLRIHEMDKQGWRLTPPESGAKLSEIGNTLDGQVSGANFVLPTSRRYFVHVVRSYRPFATLPVWSGPHLYIFRVVLTATA